MWGMTRRYALTDAQWERIQDLLPGRAGHVGCPASNNRLFVDAVLYATGQGFPGVICLNALATFAWLIFGIHAGAVQAFGNVSLRHWLRMPTTSG